MPKPRKSTRHYRVTVADVAAESGYGESTVRNCLSERTVKMYPETTVAKIKAAAEKLGYRKGNQGATQKDIAEALGVSHTAVHLAFTPGGRVSDELRTKILAKAEELGYDYQGYQPRKQAVERR